MTIDEVAALGATIERLEGIRRQVTENLARRVAKRRGLEVQKSRCRDPLSPHRGLYRVSCYRTREVLAGGEPHPYSMTLTDIARELAKGPDRYVSRARRLVD